jgi:hypothetical protein
MENEENGLPLARNSRARNCFKLKGKKIAS